MTAFQFNAAVIFARRDHEAKLDEARAITLTNKIAQMLSGKPETNHNGDTYAEGYDPEKDEM